MSEKQYHIVRVSQAQIIDENALNITNQEIPSHLKHKIGVLQRLYWVLIPLIKKSIKVEIHLFRCIKKRLKND